MFDRFKKVFVICSLDHYDFFEEYKDEILEPYQKQRIGLPFLLGKDIEEEKGKIRLLARKKSEDSGIDDYRLEILVTDLLLEQKLEYAKKQMRFATSCILIDPERHPDKDFTELDVSSSVETTMEVLAARHQKLPITMINPYDFVKKNKQKKI